MQKTKLLIFFFILSTSLISEAQYILQPSFPNLPSFANITELANARDNRLFITELNGKIYVFNNSPLVSTRKLFLDLTNKVSQTGGCGLHGIAFHPDYSNNGYFYLHYGFDSAGSISGKWLRISRFQTSSNPDSAIKNSEVPLIKIPLPETEHNGGKLAFGNDGYLYISLGDGDTPGIISQDRTEFLGKLLRINVDISSGGKNYSIPATNVYYQNTFGYKEEIYAYGFRNPWKFSFDYPTNMLWLADVGAKWFEEIDIVESGRNYGWNKMEGFHCYPDSNVCDTTGKGFARPVFEYKHRAGGLWEATTSVTGGYVYRGNLSPELYGKYIYGDFIEGKIWALNYDGINPTTTNLLLDTTYLITSFGVDNNNEIYVCRYSATNGFIYKLSSLNDAGITGVASIPADTIYTGSNICFDITVKNFGAENQFAIPVKYSVNDGPVIGLSNTGILNSGNSTLLSFCGTLSYAPPAEGNYKFKFFTSLNNDVSRLNDTSILILNVVDSLRDAGVSSVVSVPSDTIYTGTSVCLNATVRNFGLANLSSVPVRYTINDGWPVGPVNSNSINSGDSNIVLFCDENSFVPASAGSYTLKFFTSLSGDADNSNDTATLVLNVIDSLRDAGVSSVISNPSDSDTIYTGVSVCFDAVVTNYGLANLSEVPVTYTINGGSVIGPIASGAVNSHNNTSISFCDENSFIPASAGSYTLKFFTSLSWDADYTNDTTTLVLNVIDSLRDAGVSSVISITSDTIYTGVSVCFDAVLTNFGLANLSEVPVSYTVNGGSVIGPMASGAVNSNNNTSISFCDETSFVPALAGNYTLKFFTSLSGDADYTNDTTTLLVTAIDSLPDTRKILPVNISVILQGFYNPSTLKLNMRDTITIFLRSAIVPFNIVDTARTVIDSINFSGIFEFPNTLQGTYYIVIKHRNSLETWSRIGGEYISNESPFEFDFTINSSQAYGNNMILKGTKFCIYNGDINQDGEIDAVDVSLIDNKVFEYNSGYLIEDCNGDNFIDADDMRIVDNNSFHYVGVVKP